jgi:excisionase family DNA binding protein
LRFPILTMERDIGFEPTTFSLGSSGGSVAGGSKALQVVRNLENSSEGDFHSASPEAAISKDFVSGLCLGTAPRPGVTEEQRARLLSVKEVAEHLAVATATVYGLCADGRLAHVRILNVIRIAPSDLAAFVAACRHPHRPRS